MLAATDAATGPGQPSYTEYERGDYANVMWTEDAGGWKACYTVALSLHVQQQMVGVLATGREISDTLPWHLAP